MQYGLIIFAAILTFTLVILMVSFFISGKILGSLDDEFISSIKLVGFLILLGIIIYLSLIGTATWMPELISVMNNILIGLSILAVLALINKVYDIGYIKTVLFVIISTLISGVITAIIFFAIAFFAPEEYSKVSEQTLQFSIDKGVFKDIEPNTGESAIAPDNEGKFDETTEANNETVIVEDAVEEAVETVNEK